jgi:hypothetical protein
MYQALRLPFLAFVLSGSVTAAAQAAGCAVEGFTTVCLRGDRELRVIKNTISPSGRYGIA